MKLRFMMYFLVVLAGTLTSCGKNNNQPSAPVAPPPVTQPVVSSYPSCSTGYILVNGACVADPNYNGNYFYSNCPGGLVWNNNSCTCPYNGIIDNRYLGACLYPSPLSMPRVYGWVWVCYLNKNYFFSNYTYACFLTTTWYYQYYFNPYFYSSRTYRWKYWWGGTWSSFDSSSWKDYEVSTYY